MNPTDIVNLRLRNQQILAAKCKTAKDVAGWMGAMQAQDFNMAKWALGVRLPGSAEKSVAAAVDNGEIIRTHALRPTWHFVAADDVHWMLELTAPQIKGSLKSRHKQLELTDDIFAKSNRILEKALEGGNHLTREELKAALQKANIATDDARASHLFLCAELDSIICSGTTKGRKPTYALLDERVPEKKNLHREEALAKLAWQYFSSHGPATLQDFAWWSGLSVKDAKQAVEMVKEDFTAGKAGPQTYFFNGALASLKPETTTFLLPAFDEFIISYKDRKAALPFGNHNKVVSNNGIFRPAVIINGQVTGIWKRIVKKEKVMVEIFSFCAPDEAARHAIESATETFGNFLNKQAEVEYQKC